MKTVWITGGARGIGAAAVRLFARKGWRTAFSWHTSQEQAEGLLREMQAEGLSVYGVQGDLRVRSDAERCAAEIRHHFGPVDALICNAGIAQQKMFCDLTDEDWRNMFAANLDSAFYCIQSVLDDFVARKRGAIVTVSSVWGVSGASCESHYAASKAGLIGLTKSLAQELGLSGIRVNCVAPGVIDTAMNACHDAETLRALAEDTALGRLGTPEEVAQTLYFLCSEEASFVTGQVLGVTGGFVI